MFLKRCVRKKCGKEHVYWQLVELVRTAHGIRQRTVAYLGELRVSEQAGWARLAANLDAKAADSVRQLPLFRSEHDSDPAVAVARGTRTVGVPTPSLASRKRPRRSQDAARIAAGRGAAGCGMWRFRRI